VSTLVQAKPTVTRAASLVQDGQGGPRRFHLSWLPSTLQDRARESGITLPRRAPALQGLQTAARRDGWRKYPEILPHKPAQGEAIASATASSRRPESPLTSRPLPRSPAPRSSSPVGRSLAR